MRWNEPAGLYIHDELLREGFVQLPLPVLRDGNLLPGAVKLYSVILYYAWKLSYWPGVKTCEYEFGLSRRAITRYLADLEEHGYIRVERHPDNTIAGIHVLSPVRAPDVRTEGAHQKERAPDLRTEEDRAPKRSESAPKWRTVGPDRAPEMSENEQKWRTLTRDISSSIDTRLHAYIGLGKELLQRGRNLEEVAEVLKHHCQDEKLWQQVMEELQREVEADEDG